jgi:hypothetical protein
LNLRPIADGTTGEFAEFPKTAWPFHARDYGTFSWFLILADLQQNLLQRVEKVEFMGIMN